MAHAWSNRLWKRGRRLRDYGWLVDFFCARCCPRFGGSVSPRGPLPTFRRMRFPFDATTTTRLTLSINHNAESAGFRRAKGERGGIQCGEHGGGILVDDSEQSASRRFWAPPPALPVLDRVQAEPERVRESGLCHAKPISDRFHVNFLGDMRLEPFLLPSKESLNIVQAIHHLLELRFHPISHESIKCPRKYDWPVSSPRCALPWTGFLSHSSDKPQQEKPQLSW